MIGTFGATIVAVAYILVACLMGIAAGGVICVVFRQTWTAKTMRFDALSGNTGALTFGFFRCKLLPHAELGRCLSGQCLLQRVGAF